MEDMCEREKARQHIQSNQGTVRKKLLMSTTPNSQDFQLYSFREGSRRAQS
uniref:Uncharacterized protein n=1 Tax=Solanum lycopersicum TaxID=4081 RepID=A0A3Q7H985_SOLLC